MVTKFFQLPKFLGAFSFGVTLNFTYIRGFTFFIFFHFLFNMYDSNCFEQLVHNIFKKGDGEFHALFFIIFAISNLLAKRNMLSNQVEGEIIKHVHK